LGKWNEPGIRGDDGAGYDEIVGLEAGVGMADDDGVGNIGEDEGEGEVDAGELYTSSLNALVGERSSTDALLLGIGDSHGL